MYVKEIIQSISYCAAKWYSWFKNNCKSTFELKKGLEWNFTIHTTNSIQRVRHTSDKVSFSHVTFSTLI